MGTFFTECKSLEELKREYKRLCFRWHPDREGGDTATMQVVNAEYDKVDTSETAEMFRDIINSLIHMEGLEIEICGTWLWLGGATKIYKTTLKEVGCRWSSKKSLWYWRSEDNRCWYNRKSTDMEDIRSRYGSEKVEVKKKTKISA